MEVARLVERAKAGDVDAFTEQVARQWHRCGYCLVPDPFRPEVGIDRARLMTLDPEPEFHVAPRKIVQFVCYP